MHRRTTIGLLVVVLATFAAGYGGRRLMRGNTAPNEIAAETLSGDFQRIVSTAPSVTETLFALGLGDRVAGVTRFCKFPPEAIEKPKIGGYLDLNFEAMVMLRPDLVVLLDEQTEIADRLHEAHIPTLTVDHRSIDAVLESMLTIGRTCHVEKNAAQLVDSLRSRLERLAQETAGRPKPRVLIAVDRTLGVGRIEDLYVAGNEGHLTALVEAAGGTNVYDGAVRFPQVSAEGIIAMNPDIVLDCVSEEALAAHGDKTLTADWRRLDAVDAVRHRRVYLMADDHATIPGPYCVDVAERIARLIHPDANRPQP